MCFENHRSAETIIHLHNYKENEQLFEFAIKTCKMAFHSTHFDLLQLDICIHSNWIYKDTIGIGI